MLAAVPHRMFPYAKDGFMGYENPSGSEPLNHAELWGGQERDLERLQDLLDGAVEQLRMAFESMDEAAAGGLQGQRLRAQFREDARRVVTCLQFHDIASQMIANMRGRAELLEVAALAAAPGAMVEARSRLLADALHLSKSRPEVDFDRCGDVNPF